MIFFLYGKDTYRLKKKIKEIEKEYQGVYKSSLALEKINASEINFKDFWDKLSQQSIFAQKKLLFLENVFSNQEFKQEFVKKIKDLSNSHDIVVVFEKEKLLKQNKLFQGLKKHAECQEFNLLTNQELKAWLEKEFRKESREIEAGALRKMIDFVGNNLWQMENEIKKLTNYKKGTIREDDVELLVRPKIDAAIFTTIDALAQKQKDRALYLLQKHFDKGDSPLFLLSMVNFQFRNLLIAKALQEKGKTLNDLLLLNLSHPYVAKKSWRSAQDFELGQLKKIFQKIFEADLDIKTGKIQAEVGLRMLIAQI